MFIRAIFEPHWVATMTRVVRRAILSIARKNGKTALIAALVLVFLVGPEAVENAEIYSAANDREQAAQVYKVAAQIVKASPELKKIVKCIDSKKTLACHSMGSFYRAMSRESGTKHGLNPIFVIYDELAQAKDRELYDVLDTSFGAQEEPLFVVISTQSNDPEHIMSQLIDDGLSAEDPTIVCHLYAVPEDEDGKDPINIYDPETWRLANPALGTFRVEKDLEALAAKVKRRPAEEPKFRNLYLNQRVSPVSTLIARADWQALQDNPTFEDGEEVYGALDLSSVNDLSSLTMCNASSEIHRIAQWFWKPEALLKEQSKRDFGRGNLQYVQWAEAGHIKTTPGKTIDFEVIARDIAKLQSRYKWKALAFDRWRMDLLKKEFDRIGLRYTEDAEEKSSALLLIPWGQGYKDMAPAIDEFEKAVIDKTLIRPPNPCLTWNVANAVVLTDPVGNRKLDKKSAKFRIDGAVTLATVLGLKARMGDKGPSVYRNRGAHVI